MSLSGVFQTPSRLSLLRLCLTAIIVRLCEKRQFRKYHKAIIALPKSSWNMSEMYVWTGFEVSPCFSFLVVQNSWLYLNQSIPKLEIFTIKKKKRTTTHPPSAVVCLFLFLTVAHSNRPTALLCASLHCKMIHSFYL